MTKARLLTTEERAKIQRLVLLDMDASALALEYFPRYEATLQAAEAELKGARMLITDLNRRLDTKLTALEATETDLEQQRTIALRYQSGLRSLLSSIHEMTLADRIEQLRSLSHNL